MSFCADCRIEELIAKELVLSILDYVNTERKIKSQTKYAYLYLCCEDDYEHQFFKNCHVQTYDGTLFFDKSSELDIEAIEKKYGLGTNFFKKKIDIRLLMDLVSSGIEKQVNYTMIKSPQFTTRLNNGSNGRYDLVANRILLYVDWIESDQIELRTKNMQTFLNRDNLDPTPKNIAFIFGILAIPLIVFILAIVLMLL